MKLKRKLTIDEQVDHMETKGIKFSIVSKEEAKTFLMQNNYYFKLKSFAKNYEQYQSDPNKGKYLNLEFAYLKELAVLDMRLRKILFSMTSDVEHFLKVKLLNEFSDNEHEDGYHIVQMFMTNFSYIPNSIANKCHNSATSDLIRKHCGKWAIWNLVEILTFGDFVKLYELYYATYPQKDTYIKLLGSIKFLRNASAHNNCILNSIRNPYLRSQCNKSTCHNKKVFINNSVFSPTTSVSIEIGNIQNYIGVSRLVCRKMLHNPVVHDLTALFMVHSKICSSGVVDFAGNELKEFFHERCFRNPDYFTQNQPIISIFGFLRKIVDYYYP